VFVAFISWFLQYGFFVLGAAMAAQAVLAWSGTWRRWVLHLPPGFAVTRLNFFPFCMGLFGLGLVFIGLSINADAGTVPGPEGVYDGIGVLFFALSLVAFVWWPAALAPGWHRDWIRWAWLKGTDPRETDPWPTEAERAQGRR
jgi:hypothetical protein